ncbi:toll/interleukin-1 receptor domain-containing protein [Aquimarina sp. RZ0]|uniref:toll/interleukin-1 receptor domain-containing protein n=1 Tax=Aquimarina sp. RZ0 TaxID=2607730 RepID=UPI0011F18077|nr:toll/interleukin-1 receptor domain-containing protein [Aquimarina sp. RZ0]KAA1245868.1 TIR domain-containing protein [Aquimarina sp. RZ0]
MNIVEKNALAQEISLYLFAKYTTSEMVKKMNDYQVDISKNTIAKRSSLTRILKEQEEQVLLRIQNNEHIRGIFVTPTGTPKKPNVPLPTKPKKIFISHSKKDLIYVQEIINILETIGIYSNLIFCSSYEGYGNPLGSNYLEVLKNELQGNTLVLFVLSQNFFSSRTCLCEMGAAWILTQQHIPMYIPPFQGEDVQGVFPTTQGMSINKKSQLILLKERLEKDFDIQNKRSYVKWNQQIDRSLHIINSNIQ